MSSDALQKCLAWSELLHKGRAPRSKALEPLLEAGLAAEQNREVVLLDQAGLQDIVDRQCQEIVQARDQAQALADSLGLELSINSRPKQALQLLQELERTAPDAFGSWQMQSISSKVFGDSKLVQRISLLKSIFVQWSRLRHLKGELRLKSFGRLLHLTQGLDLGQVTASLGQVCIPAPQAARIENFELQGVDLVLTSENLAPFRQACLSQGLVLYCPGYDTALPALWLQRLPRNCVWMHLGDFDPDGLGIFEQLRRQSRREGRFVPSIKQLQEIQGLLPRWSKPKGFEPGRYVDADIRELAVWGQKQGAFAEQEQILHLLGWSRLCASYGTRFKE